MDTRVNFNSKFPNMGTTIFAVMSALAREHAALNMAQGFPDFACPPELIDLVNVYMKKGMNQYAPMPGVIELRERIAEKTENLYSAKYNPDTEITIVPGATLALSCAISAIVRENDEVIVIEPCYDSYIPVIELMGARPVFAKMKYPHFNIDWTEVKKLVNFKTRAIIINSPHNPTGYTYTAQDLQQLEKIVENTDIVVISDEVYEHIIFDGKEHQSVTRYPKLAERSFVISSFGKTYHNTGWKTGYVLAPEKLSAEFRKIYQYAAFSTNTPVQYAFADFLKNSEHYLSLPAFYQNKRDYFQQVVKGSKFKVLPCQGSYFQLLGFDKISQETDKNFAVELTQKFKLASVPISVFYHDRTDNSVLRFCFAKSEETLSRAAEIIHSI